MTDGDLQKADHLLDCSWFEYYYRIQQLSIHAERKAEAIRNLKSK